MAPAVFDLVVPLFFFAGLAGATEARTHSAGGVMIRISPEPLLKSPQLGYQTAVFPLVVDLVALYAYASSWAEVPLGVVQENPDRLRIANPVLASCGELVPLHLIFRPVRSRFLQARAPERQP